MCPLQYLNATWFARVRRVRPFIALLLICAGGFGAPAVASAPMRFERLGLDDGLSQQAVLAIAQDAEGFMWFGTEDGLNRFDGYAFKHIRQADGGLSDDFIADLQVDRAGRFWVATDGGAVLWRGPGETAFESILTGLTESASRGLERPRVIRVDHTGRLWIGTRAGGVAWFDPTTHHVLRLRHQDADPDSLDNDSVYALLEDHTGTLWVGTQTGLNRVDAKSHHIQHVRLGPGTPVRVHALLEDIDGSLWIGTDTGLVRMDPTTGSQVQFHHDDANPLSLAASQVNTLFLDSHKRLWIGTANGLSLLDREHGTFDGYHNDPADAYSLPDDHILALHEDHTGLLWIGTRFGGVARWNPRTWSFGQHNAGAEEGMPSRNVMAFTEEASGRLWVATFGGGITLAATGRSPPLTLRKRPGGLSDDRVMTLMTDREGDVWAGTMEGGLDRINPRTLQVKVFDSDPNDPATLGAPGVMSLLEDSAGRIWAGTYGGGLSRLDRATGHFKRYAPDPADPNSLAGDRVTALAEDPTGRIWVGTDGGGLNVLEPETGRFFHLQHDPRNGRSSSGPTVYSIYVDPRHTVWVGTRSGLDRVVGSALVPEAVRFDHFNDRNGLPNDTVYGIHADETGRLWLSTNYGLARFDPRTEQVSSFHRSHGLQAEEFNFGAHYAGRDGRLFFGGAKGYNAFDPARIQFDTAPPPIALTSVLELGRELPLGPRFDMPRLHFRDVVSFEFAALDFTAPKANQFAFKLEGFDKDWERAGARRTVTYTNLPDGRYTLRVRAANPDGVWNEAGYTLPLQVDPPPWLSRWAWYGYTFILLAIIILCWEGHRRSLVREARYSRRLREEVNTRTRELAARNKELEIANDRLERASLTDHLTGLGNRRALIKDMPQILARLEAESRCHGRPARMTLMLVDLDRLKPINDAHGHEAGDLALEEVASQLRLCLRDCDRVVRWGGDEFVIVRTQSDIDDAAQLAEAIRARVAEQRFKVSQTTSVHTTVSIGFACYPFVTEAPLWASWEEVLHLADMALYRAKARRDAWLGWCGLPRAARQTELFKLIAADPAGALTDGYIDVRISPCREGEDPAAPSIQPASEALDAGASTFTTGHFGERPYRQARRARR
jgi:diguanylate cyclase (GGDEF)-like protein